MVAGFEVTSASRTRGREEIELGIRGPSCLLRAEREKRKFWDFFLHSGSANYIHI